MTLQSRTIRQLQDILRYWRYQEQTQCQQPQAPKETEPQVVMGIGVAEARQVAEDLKQEQVEQSEVLRSALTELLVEPEKKSQPANDGIMAAVFSRIKER